MKNFIPCLLLVPFLALVPACNLPPTPFFTRTETVVTNMVPPGVEHVATNTTFEVSKPVSAVIDTVTGVNAVVPSPFQPFIALGLTGLSALLALIARRASSKASSATDALSAVVSGVELGAHPETKKEIFRAAILNGSQPTVARAVSAISG